MPVIKVMITTFDESLDGRAVLEVCDIIELTLEESSPAELLRQILHHEAVELSFAQLLSVRNELGRIVIERIPNE